MLSECLIAITAPLSTGTQSFTCTDQSSNNFQPIAIMIRGTIATAVGTVTGACACFGLAAISGTTVTNQVALCQSIKNGSNSGSTNYSRQATSKIISLVDPATGTVTAEANISAVSSTGFTLNWTTAPASAYLFEAFVLGGSDLSGCDVGNFLTNTSTGNQTISGLSGTPAATIFSSSANTGTTTATDSTEAVGMLGWAIDSTHRAVSCFTGVNGSSNSEVQLTNACVAITGSSTVSRQADFVSSASGQFVINLSIAGATQFNIWYLTLYGTFNVATFSNSSPTSTGNQGNSLAFSPAACLIQSQGVATSSSVGTSQISACYGMADASTNFDDCFLYLENSKATSAKAQSVDAAQALQMWTVGSTSTKLVEAAVNSFTSGVQLNFTTVDPTARQYVGLALGSAPASDTDDSGTLGSEMSTMEAGNIVAVDSYQRSYIGYEKRVA